MTVRIASFGAGLIGRAHARELQALPPGLAALVGIADPPPAAAERGVPHFAEVEALLDTAKPDAAIVATPNVLHGPHATACFDRGIHVLIEDIAALLLRFAGGALGTVMLSDATPSPVYRD